MKYCARLACLLIIQTTFIQTATIQTSVAQELEPLRVNYFTRETNNKTASAEGYWVALLELALKKSGVSYQLNRYKGSHLTHKSMVAAVESNRPFLTVLFMGTTKEFEQRLLPVRIPVFRGLIGYRIFIINKTQQHRFSGIQTVKELQTYRFGLGHYWSDIESYKNAGFKVVEAKYNSLFKLVANGRVDLFSRGINEIYSELESVGVNYPELTDEKKLLLAYKHATFFFVSKHNPSLHDALLTGLLKAYEDGSFLRYFSSHPTISQTISRANLHKRTVISIENTNLTPETQAIPDKYWYSIP